MRWSMLFKVILVGEGAIGDPCSDIIEAGPEFDPEDEEQDQPLNVLPLALKLIVFGAVVAGMVWLAFAVIRFFMVASYG